MLVELHGGSVDARSPGLGQGTEIIVRLPIHSDTQPTEEPSTEAPARILEHTSRRILIVDDNADAAQSLATALELSGHRVAVAYDGPSAVEWLSLNAPTSFFSTSDSPVWTGTKWRVRSVNAQSSATRASSQSPGTVKTETVNGRATLALTSISSSRLT
jgi:PleD family two-component response regulator